jgi:hypothetical protein
MYTGAMLHHEVQFNPHKNNGRTSVIATRYTVKILITAGNS